MTDRADRPIAVGDLVYIWRTACNCSKDEYLGAVRRVERLHSMGVTCHRCGWKHVGANAGVLGDFCRPLSTLRRIPPLDELESSKTDEPMKEPA